MCTDGTLKSLLQQHNHFPMHYTEHNFNISDPSCQDDETLLGDRYCGSLYIGDIPDDRSAWCGNKDVFVPTSGEFNTELYDLVYTKNSKYRFFLCKIA